MAGTRLPQAVEAEAPETTAAPAEPPLGDQLKSMFEAVAASPMPERLTRLVDQLEEKYRAGELRPERKH